MRGGKRKTTKEWVAQATLLHNDFYSYEKSVYVTAFHKIIVTCPKHGDFTLEAKSHIRGTGCKACWCERKGDYFRSNKENFIRKAIEKHGEKYDYSKVVYTLNRGKVVIGCPVHGDFKQTPNDHLSGYGCQSCSKTGFSRSEKGYLYCLMSVCGTKVKIGITNNIAKRIKYLNKKTPFQFELYRVYEASGAFVETVEKQIHANFNSMNLQGFHGCTEWLVYDEQIILDLELTFSSKPV